MEKVLISMPAQLVARMRAVIPARQRSQTFTRLIAKEIEKREKALYECALAVEKDSALKEEMKDWDVTLQDGLDDESW
jgi:hypothetical protein